MMSDAVSHNILDALIMMPTLLHSVFGNSSPLLNTPGLKYAAGNNTHDHWLN